MDPASVVLSEGLEPTRPQTYTALSEDGEVPRTTLWYRAHGRPSKEEKDERQQYLTPSEEKALVKHLLRRSDHGYPVPVKHLRSLALIITRQRPSAFRAPATDETIKPPGKNWPQAFYKRHPELKAKRVKALDWNRHDNNIYDKITHWFEVIGKELHDPVILPENVYNMDETGVMLSMLGSLKVLVGKDDPRGYTDSKISLEWIKRVFDPQTKPRANQKPRVLICDGFGTHESLEVMEYCFENSIILCRIPSHTSHKLQPCDVGVFGPLKAAYREEVERLYRGGADTVGKQHFTSLYSPARERSLTRRNILAGWAKAGLHPLNPDRVLRDIQKPPAEVCVSQEGEVKVESCPQEALQTPVTSEALASLRSLIEQDTYMLDEPSKQRLQKLANAAQKSFAECALLLDENQLLFKQNTESKSRKSTRSTVVGKAKVMSYEDIVEAQTKRDAKEAAVVKGKRGRKRKATAPEETQAKRTRKSEMEVAEEIIEAEGMGNYCSVLQL